jgi:GAF domain-containing protein/anti-sigma regulatory factor (Ser/Thr protein kinase)
VFSLPLDPARLLRARQRIRDYLNENVADAAAVDDVVLAIEEAMTNAVRHSEAVEDLDVTVSFHGDELVATVRDHGCGFDVEGFDAAALPDVDQPGGRGLFLISRLMDELHLHRDHGLVLRAVKRTRLREETHSAGPIKDMTPGALAHRDLSQRKMLDELPELCAALDWEFRYLYVNRMFCEVTGRESHELLGRTLWEVFPEVIDTEVEGWLQEAMRLGLPRAYEFFFPPLATWFEQRLYPTAYGISQFSVPINERKRRELEREDLQTALGTAWRQRQLALDAAAMGWWHYDPASGIATYDEGYKRIFGVSGSSRPNDEILKRLHPDDLPGVWARVEAALDPADPRPYAAEYRIFVPDVGERWIEAHGLAEFEGAGEERRATGLVGTVMDITERKATEAEHQEFVERLQAQTEELQAQTEELQAQSEELQAQSEELQTQSEALQHQNDDLLVRNRLAEALTVIGRRVHASLWPNDVLQTALSEGVTALGLDAGAIEMWEQECWTLRFQYGFSAEDVGVCLNPADAPNASRVLRERELLTIVDMARDPKVNVGFVRAKALRSVLAVPLIVRGEMLGCLLFYGRRPHRFTRAETDFGRALGATLSQAIDNARLYEAEALARSAARRDLEATRVLLDAAATVSSLTELDEMLQALADLVARSTDHQRVVLELWHEERREVEVAAAAGPAAPAHERFAFGAISEAARQVIRTRQTQVIDYAETGRPEALHEYLDEHRFRLLLAVPMVYRDRLVGLIMVDQPGERREFGEREIQLVEAIGSQAGVAIANAQLYEAQRDIALTLQESLMHPLPAVRGLQMAAVSLPAGHADLVGGDFHDVAELGDGRVLALIGDVMGKGVPAAGLTETVRSAARMAALLTPSPGDILQSVNRLLLQRPDEDAQLATLLLVVLDVGSGKGVMASAGHPPAMRVADGAGAMIEPVFGAPLGAFDEPYAETTFELGPGEDLVLYTDGVTEARGPDGPFAEAGLLRAARDCGPREPRELVACLQERLLTAAGQLKDDVQILVLRREA